MKYFLNIGINSTNDGFPSSNSAKDNINVITLYDIDNDNPIILCLTDFYDSKYADKIFEDETSLLLYVNEMFKTSIIYGYNIEGFDIPYIKKRCERIGIEPYDITYKDMFVDVKDVLNLSSYGLITVMQEITGEDISKQIHKDNINIYKILYKYLYAVEIRDNKLKQFFDE